MSNFDKFPGREEGVTSDSYDATDKIEIHREVSDELFKRDEDRTRVKLRELGVESIPDLEREEHELLRAQTEILSKLAVVRDKLKGIKEGRSAVIRELTQKERQRLEQRDEYRQAIGGE